MYRYHPHHTRRDFIRIFSVRVLGNFLILFSLYMIAWVFYRPVLEEIKYSYNSFMGKRYAVSEDAQVDQTANPQDDRPTSGVSLSDILQRNRVQPLIPADPQYSILIPKLGANAKIIPGINAANEREYLDALKLGVAQASGTGNPGEGHHIYLFAHSTNTFSNVSRYNALFYLLYKLEPGDEINLYYQGVRHKYQVTGSTIVDPSEVSYLTSTTDFETVTLQTCWPPGTTLQRMLVFAEPVE